MNSASNFFNQWISDYPSDGPLFATKFEKAETQPAPPLLLSAYYAAHDWLHQAPQAALERLQTGLLETTRLLGENAVDQRSQAIVQGLQAILELNLGHLPTARQLAATALVSLQGLNDLWGVAILLQIQAEIARQQNNSTEAETLSTQAQSLLEQVHHKRQQALQLEQQGKTARFQGNLRLARAAFEQSAALFREATDLAGQARTFYKLGQTVVAFGDHNGGTFLWRAGMRLTQQLHTRPWVELLLWAFGQMLLTQAVPERAELYFEESLSLSREMGATPVTLLSLWGLGQVAHLENNYGLAQECYRKALVLAWRNHEKLALACSIFHLAKLAQSQNNLTKATGLFQKSLSMYRKLSYRPGIKLCQAALQELEGQPGYKPVARRMNTRAGNLRPTTQLTSREIEVLRLVATGLTNGEVAEKLNLSTLTVGSYLRSVYNKLGVNSRTAAAHHAVLNHLL